MYLMPKTSSHKKIVLLMLAFLCVVSLIAGVSALSDGSPGGTVILKQDVVAPAGSAPLNAQDHTVTSPSVKASICLGDTSDESGRRIRQTSDNGYIVLSLDVLASYVSDDNRTYLDLGILVSKLDANLNIQWENVITHHTLSNEGPGDIRQTSDGGYIIIGSTSSSLFPVGGDVPGIHGVNSTDVWVIKLNSLGNVVWEKAYGGVFDDAGETIIPLLDGGYLGVATTYSQTNDCPTGQVTGNHGGADIWVFKISSDGTLIWQKCFGGSNDEAPIGITVGADGGYIISGWTSSTDGDVTGGGYHGGIADAWIFKINKNGDIIWQHCYGGNKVDVVAEVYEVPDGYITSGLTISTDIPRFHYNTYIPGNNEPDLWALKISKTGNVVWQNAYGSYFGEYGGFGFPTFDGGIIVIGKAIGDPYDLGGDGDVSGIHHLYGTPTMDLWAIKVDKNGNLAWQKCLGGSYADGSLNGGVIQTQSGGYAILSDSSSNDYDLSGAGNHLPNIGIDPWVVTLNPDVSLQYPAPVINAVTELTNTDLVDGSKQVRAAVNGYGFIPGAAVRLKKTGNTDILALSADLITLNQIYAMFSVPSTTSGVWDLVVKNPDGQESTLAGAITFSGADTTPPIISIICPSNNQVFTTSSVTVSGTASDNVGLSKVEVKIGSGSWQTATGTTSWSQLVTLASGSNTIYAKATDTSGNTQETSVTVTYTAGVIAPVAAFSGSPRSGTKPLTVTFTDSSTNTPTSWNWNFGDSSSVNATMQNPVHTYASAGTYTVSLTATNSVGSNVCTKTNYITVNAASGADNVGIFRGGVFYRNGASAVVYGLSTDTPVVGDWNGDGISEVGVYRGGVFYRNGASAVVYGLSTDTPVVGDWNGDGMSEVGVYRGGVFYRNGASAVVYGLSTDTPVVGDWNGDGMSEVGVYRDGVFYRNGADAIVYGISTDTPVIGKWT